MRLKASVSPLLLAIYQGDYDYLEQNAAHFLVAIADELKAGKTPRDIKHMVLANTTAERNGMAMRCFNAAMHMARLMEAEQT